MQPLKYKEIRELDRWEFDEYLAKLLEESDRVWTIMEDASYDGFHQDSYLHATVELGREIEEEEGQDFTRWLEGGQLNDPLDRSLYTDEDAYQADLKYWEKYEKNATPGFQEMIQWICNRGLIPTGSYVMHIWW